MGEAVGGDQWLLCRGVGCTDALDPTTNPLGLRMPAHVGWIIGQPCDEDQPNVFGSGMPMACCIERLNKNPVTENYMALEPDRQSVQRDCRSSLTLGTAAVNSTSNFRSQHVGGGMFLRCDGSAKFVSENVDINLYRATSTIAGGEVRVIPAGAAD